MTTPGIYHTRTAPHERVDVLGKRGKEQSMNLIYLASPYGHDKPTELRQARYEAALQAEAAMMKRGLMVYSPIVHRHPGAVLGLYPIGWEYWKDFDELILSRCDELCILRLPGWGESSGVNAEYEIALRLRLTISYEDEVL